MAFTKKKRKFVLCFRKDDTDESRPCSPIEIGQRKPKKPSLWSRIRTCLSKRFSTRIRIRIRFKKPWKKSSRVAHRDFKSSRSSRRTSLLAAPSLSVISETLEENSDVNSASSKTESKKDVSSTEVNLDANTRISPVMSGSCNIIHQITSDSSSSNNVQHNNSNRTHFTKPIKPENLRRPKMKPNKPSEFSDTNKPSDSYSAQKDRVNKLQKKISNKRSDDVKNTLYKTFNKSTDACNGDQNTGSLMNIEKTELLQKSSRRKAVNNEGCVNLPLINDDEKETRYISEYKTGYNQENTAKKQDKRFEVQANDPFGTTNKDPSANISNKDKHIYSLNNGDNTGKFRKSSRKKKSINEECLKLTSSNDGEKETKCLPENKTGTGEKPGQGFEDKTKKSYESMTIDESTIACKRDKYTGSLNNVDKTEELQKSTMNKEVINKECEKLAPSNNDHKENKHVSEYKPGYNKESTLETSNKGFEDQTKESNESIKIDESTIAGKRDKYFSSLNNADKTEKFQNSSIKKEVINEECVNLTPSNNGHKENRHVSEYTLGYNKECTQETSNKGFEDQTKETKESIQIDESTIAVKRDKCLGSLNNVDKTEELQKSTLKKEVISKECVNLTPSNNGHKDNRHVSEHKPGYNKESTLETSNKEFEDQTKKSYESIKIDKSTIAVKGDKYLGSLNNADKTEKFQRSTMKKEVFNKECEKIAPSNNGHKENKHVSEYKPDYNKESTLETSNKEFEDQTKESKESIKIDESTIAGKTDKYIGSLNHVDKTGEFQKSLRKETIIYEKCVKLTCSNDSEKETKHINEYKIDKKEHIVAKEKFNLAASKWANKLKSASNVDQEQKTTEVPVYHPSRPKTNKEKETTNDIRKKILQKIYKEVNIAPKVPIATKQQWPPMESKSGGNTVYEYETTDGEMYINDDPKPIKNNIVIIPKPKGKSESVANISDTKKVKNITNQNRPVDSKYDQCIYRPSESLNEYTTNDFINDIDDCVANLKPKSPPPKPRDTTLAPNPFPVNKNNLPQVCPPKRERPEYRQKRIINNPLLAGVDATAIKRISAPAQLGKLKEVRNRLEPTPEIFLRTGKKETNYDAAVQNMSLPTYPALPLGKLQPKGRHSSMVDVKFFTQYEAAGGKDSSILQRKHMKSLNHQHPKTLDNLTQSQQNKYSKLQSTFRTRGDHLPDAKFWTDLAKGKHPVEYESEKTEFLKAENEEELMKSPRCYFNEPPLGADNALPGRHHSKRDENLEFFLTISRNPFTFYQEPTGPYDEPGPSNVPQGYNPQKGYIPDDPYI